MKAISRECDNCGKKLLRYVSKVKPCKHTFCSRECRKKYHRPQIKCPGCGELFLRNPKSPGNKYCSWECFKKSRWLKVVCFQCKKPFLKRTSEIKKSKEHGSQHMCSRSCRNVYTSFQLGGDGTWIKGGKYRTAPWYDGKYGWDWARIRTLALRRANYKCEQCERRKNLHVHHWEPFWISQNSGLDNLVVLCRECHKEKHIEYRREGFYEDLRCVSGW